MEDRRRLQYCIIFLSIIAVVFAAILMLLVISDNEQRGHESLQPAFADTAISEPSEDKEVSEEAEPVSEEEIISEEYQEEYYSEDENLEYMDTSWYVDNSVNTTTYEETGSVTDLQWQGVTSDGIYTYTWYSQNILPGEALDIPGRTINEDGLVTDGDGNIAVASSDLPYGTELETPYGSAVVYDTGCASGVVDIYTAW
jgi:hypothetical protein